MTTNTPETDDEASLMSLDCDDSCVEIYIKRDGKYAEGDFVLADFARKLERERDEARAELKSIRAAIQTIYYDTEGYADGAPDASRHDKLCNEIAATLKHYLK